MVAEAIEVAGEVVTTTEETITIGARTAMTGEMVTTIAATDVAAAATVKSSRLAVSIRLIGMIPQMIKPWYHTMGDSQQTNSSVCV